MMARITDFFRRLFLITLLSLSTNIFADTVTPVANNPSPWGQTYPNATSGPIANSGILPPGVADTPTNRILYQNYNPPTDMGDALGVINGGTFSSNLTASIDGLTTAIDNFQIAYRSRLAEDSIKLLGALSVIAIAWAGMKLAMTTGSLSEPMNKLITTIFTIGVASYLITNTEQSGSGYELMVVNGIDGLMNHLVSLVPNGSPKISTMFQSFMASEFDTIGQVITTFKDYKMWDWVTKGGFTIFLLIIMFFALLMTSILGMIATLTSLVMVAIALAIGPIFIPFLVLEKTSFLFDGWLKFTINACLTKVVIALLLGIGIAAFKALALQHAAGSGSGGSMIGTLISTLAISGVIGSLMLTAPGIAGAITSGGAISQDGFAGRMHSAAKIPGSIMRGSAAQSLGNRMAENAKSKGKTSAIGNALKVAAKKV